MSTTPAVRQLWRCMAVVLSVSVAVYAQGNSWSKVRYNGGTLQTKVDPDEWNNQLTVTSDTITLKLKDGQTVDIPCAKVSGLSYGQEAHRRVGTMIALGILVAPIALFGLFHKTRLHYIGIEYTTEDGKKAGILLQGHKDNYRAILMALRGATGAKVTVAEADRQFVPTGIETEIADKEKPAAQTGKVLVTSTPDGAEVSVDGEFMGNAPATLNLPAGKHSIRVKADGYKEWSRELSVLPGGSVSLTASLEKR